MENKTYTVDLGAELGRINVSPELLDWLFENRREHGGIAPAYALVAVNGQAVVTGAVR